MNALKNLIIGILFTGCLFLYFCKSPKIEQAEKIVQKEKDVAAQVEAQVDIIAQKFDEDGLLHATIKAKNEIKPEQAKYVGVLDTAAMKLNIQAKQIIELTAVITKMKAEKLKATRTVVLGRPVYNYEDQFAKIAFRPDTIFDTIGVVGGEFDLAYNSKLKIVQYQKRNWFLGEKRSYIDISTNDIRNTVNGVERLTIKQNRPIFGLRAQGMATFNVASQKILVGPAIRFDVGRFSVHGARLYEPTFTNKPVNVIGLTYDALIF